MLSHYGIYITFLLNFSILSLSNLNLLALKLGELILNLRPSLTAIHKRLDSIDDLLLLRSDLVGAVTISQGNSTVLNCLEIDGDAERSTEFIVSAVSLTDAGRRVVHTAGDTGTAETLGQLLKERLELSVGGEGNKQNLGRGHSGRER